MPAFEKIKKILRSNVWWNSKIPPLYAFAYFFLYLRQTEFIDALLELGLFMVWVVGAAGFGNYVNDLSDIEKDAKAGKENAAAGHTPGKRTAIIMVLIFLALLPWIIRQNVTCLLLTIFHLVLFSLYSIPPIRLKERGLAGIFTDAIYAHVVPTLVAIFFFGQEVMPGDYRPTLVAVIVWGLVFGIRGILTHQVADLENDKISGTRTFVVEVGVEKLVSLLKYVLIPLEFISFIIIWWLNRENFGMLLWIFPAYILYKFLLGKYVWKMDFGVNHGLNAYNSFFSNFYEQWLSLILVLLLISLNYAYVWVLFVHLFLFQETVMNFRNEIKSIYNFFR